MSRQIRDEAVTAGFFNKQVTLLTPVTIDDGQGGEKTSWQTFGSGPIYAHIDTGNAGRMMSAGVFAGQIYPTNHATITIRYQTGITPKLRIQYKSKVYIVQEVTVPHESNIAVELYCVEYQEKGT